MCQRKLFTLLFLVLLFFLLFPGWSQEVPSEDLPLGWQGLSLSDQWQLVKTSAELGGQLRTALTLLDEYKIQSQILSEQVQILEKSASEAMNSSEIAQTALGDLMSSYERQSTRNRILRSSLAITGGVLAVSLIIHLVR